MSTPQEKAFTDLVQMRFWFIISLIALLVSSCSVQRRRYMKGWYFEKKNNTDNKIINNAFTKSEFNIKPVLLAQEKQSLIAFNNLSNSASQNKLQVPHKNKYLYSVETPNKTTCIYYKVWNRENPTIRQQKDNQNQRADSNKAYLGFFLGLLFAVCAISITFAAETLGILLIFIIPLAVISFILSLVFCLSS
ncbi:MAG: hypothetical protein ACXVOH_13115, partial [Bacteroidia bacterium]